MQHATSKRRWLTATLAAVALLSVSAWANATPMRYTAHLTSLNDSGVTGTAHLTLDMDLDTLTVDITATGLEPNQTHVQHIHGLSDGSGNPIDSTTPTLAQDTNGDGLVEVTEGAATYGAILVPLTPFSTAPSGTMNYSHTFDLTDSGIYFGGASEADLIPLYFREIVIHGLTTPIDISNGGLDGATFFAAGTYVPTLPVASGIIAAPEPAELGMMFGGLGLIFGLLWLRRRTDA
ncbi:MAG TPA: CHRD domain-containing protein [Oleiagrimonas sp.]|nr:CHRD domain-containing protein [Oleiagrimonas sp.]